MLFDGEDVTRLPTEKRNIAQVFQFPVIYDTMTVGREPGVSAEEPRHAERRRSRRASPRSRAMLDLTPDLDAGAPAG